MSQNLYSLSLESTKFILGLIRDTVDLPTTILDDLNIATNTTYSSYRLDTLLKALKEENIEYCDSAIAGLNKLSKEIITDKSQITNENTIYLLLTDPVNNIYEQWLLINGTPQMIGTTEKKLDSVYTKDEADDRYALLTDFNNLVTSVEKKIDKDKIVTVLNDTVTDDEVPSAKAVVDELDLKANDSEVVKKTDITTTIDLSSTDKQVASALLIKTELDKTNAKLGEKADKSYVDDKVNETISNPTELDTNKYIKNGFYSIGDARSRTNLPVQQVGTLLVYYAGNYVIQEYILNENLRTFIRRSTDKGANWSAWKELATMDKVLIKSVADVGVTTITPVNSGITGTIEYTVKNGICYVSFKNVKSTTDTNNLSISTTMPKSSINCGSSLFANGKNGNIAFLYIDKNTTKLNGNFWIAGISGSCSFSYPVAES